MQKVLLTVYWDDLMSLYQVISFVKNVNICGFSFFFFQLWSSCFLMFKIRSFQFRDDVYFLAHLLLVFQSFHPIGSLKIIWRTRFCMYKEQTWLQSMDVILLSRH